MRLVAYSLVPLGVTLVRGAMYYLIPATNSDAIFRIFIDLMCTSILTVLSLALLQKLTPSKRRISLTLILSLVTPGIAGLFQGLDFFESAFAFEIRFWPITLVTMVASFFMIYVIDKELKLS